MPGTTTPEPSPFVHVALQASPSASITEMWVVEPSRDERKRSRKPSLVEALEELGGALGLRGVHRRDDARAASGGAGPRSSSPRE